MMTPFASTKIFRFPDRVSRILQGEPCPPVTVELDLTNQCNHRCPECAGGRSTRESLTTSEAVNYLNQLVEAGCKAVTFTGGGEPLCHPDAVSLVQKAQNLGLDVGFITNGGLLTKDRVDALLDSCCWIRVSLDAADPANYARIHGRDTEEYYKVIRNISLLGERKAIRQSECTVGVGYLADSKNRDGLPEIAKKLAQAGIDYLQVRPFHHRPEPISESIKAAKQYETAKFRVVSSVDKYLHIGESRPYTYCYGAEVCGVIQADSGVPLCCHLRGRTMLGWLRNGEQFQQIWYGTRKREILRALDLSTCVPLCRCDGINRTIHNISRPVQHCTFL